MAHQFRGQQNRRARKKSGFSQAHTRRHQLSYDQHGRQWFMNVGVKTGLPIGLIEPVFDAPWMPDHQFVRINRENPSELYIDYDAMLLRRRAVMQAYHKQAREFARLEKLPEPPVGQYSEEIIRRMGHPPRPIQPVIAAMQDNVYILGPTYAEIRGIRYLVDGRLVPFVTRPTAIEEILAEFDFRTSPEDFAATRERNQRAAKDRVEKARARQREQLLEDLSFDLEPEELKAIAEAPIEELQSLLQIQLESRADEAFGDAPIAEDTDLVDSVLTGDELAQAEAAELDETHDPEAVGGRTVTAQREAIRQGETTNRTPGARGVDSRRADRIEARKRRGDNRPSMAQGAAPVVASDEAE